MVPLRIRRNRHDKSLSTGVKTCLRYRGYGRLNTPLIRFWRIRFREPVYGLLRKSYSGSHEPRITSLAQSANRGVLSLQTGSALLRSHPPTEEAALARKQYDDNEHQHLKEDKRTHISGYHSPYARPASRSDLAAES